jgi:hypothetical protein
VRLEVTAALLLLCSALAPTAVYITEMEIVISLFYQSPQTSVLTNGPSYLKHHGEVPLNQGEEDENKT